ncbi:putative 40S ribosomal protein S17-B [Paratrimastix pyriformis]|uniref:40S ribosomal protein S17-B n=1 Tax=Paratrimastix pyriformis TaxID=342808 RepID=A0ABQ8UDV4_9EUKA|nr:putative 40S ribosomal protein S17-B [Paratrimastix pyriformis]
MSYYDLDEILAEEQVIPVQFKREAADLGHLDPSSLEDRLAKDARVELPLWMGKSLLEHNIARVGNPKHLAADFQSMVTAAPTHVNLSPHPYYYEVGCQMARLTRERGLVPYLVRSFADRFQMILQTCHNCDDSDRGKFLQKLTVSEVKLFNAGNESLDRYRHWRNRSNTKLKPSPLLGLQRHSSFKRQSHASTLAKRHSWKRMGRVRTKTIKKAARVIIEKYYPRMTRDFQVNKRVCEEVAIIPSKRLRNKIAGFATHLMARIEKGPVRGISLKLQEEERERRDNYCPEVSDINTSKIVIDSTTKDMLKQLGMETLPGLEVQDEQQETRPRWNREPRDRLHEPRRERKTADRE